MEKNFIEIDGAYLNISEIREVIAGDREEEDGVIWANIYITLKDGSEINIPCTQEAAGKYMGRFKSILGIDEYRTFSSYYV